MDHAPWITLPFVMRHPPLTILFALRLKSARACPWDPVTLTSVEFWGLLASGNKGHPHSRCVFPAAGLGRTFLQGASASVVPNSAQQWFPDSRPQDSLTLKSPRGDPSMLQPRKQSRNLNIMD